MSCQRYSQSLFVLALVCICLGAGCNTPPDKKYIKDGKQHGVVRGLFRERWWNFYERGCSFLEGGYYAEAIADFKEALKQSTRDQRRARTYGMHVIEFFPHRELGVAYYHLGNYRAAEKELEISLSAVDTGRAKYYLNEVRRSVLKVSTTATPPPRIILNAETEQSITKRFTITVAGVIEADAYVHTLVINGEPVFIELAQKRLVFAKSIKLHRGLNRITIKSRDLLGNEAEKTIAVTADVEGPLLHINNAISGAEISENCFVLQGSLSDDSGIIGLKINEFNIPYRGERNVSFMHPVQLVAGINRILFQAEDSAGNTTTGELSLICIAGLAWKNTRLAYIETKQHIRNIPTLLAFQGNGMLDTGAHRLFTAGAPEQPASPLSIHLKNMRARQTVYYNNLYLDGSVTSANEIAAVTIHNVPLSIKPGKVIFFSQLVELNPGENTLTIQAHDKKGARAEKTIVVVYQIPPIRQLGARMSLAILPFEQTGAVTATSAMIGENLVSAFLRQERFNIVSRGPAFEAALRELKLSGSDLVDTAAALRTGRLVTADGILTGTIHETDNSIEVYARLINAETATIMDAQDVYGEDKTLPHIQYLVNGLALKFKHSFPLIEGIVVKTAGKNIYTDVGAASGIKRDMKFIIFRQGESLRHPLTENYLGTEIKELGQARVVNVFEAMTIGRLIAEPGKGQPIQVKDRIITK